MSAHDDKKSEVMSNVASVDAEDVVLLEEDDEIINDLLLPDDKIDYPAGDKWSNLGRNIRQQVARETRPILRFRPIMVFAAAASFMFIMGIVVMRFSEQTDYNTPGRVAVQEDNQSVDEPVDAEFATMELLMLQTELDLLSLELCESDPTVSDLDCLDIREIIQSNEVGTDLVIEDYMQLL